MSKPLLFDGIGGGLKVETWLLDMGHFLSLHPYESNMKALCVVMKLRDHRSIEREDQD